MEHWYSFVFWFTIDALFLFFAYIDSVILTNGFLAWGVTLVWGFNIGMHFTFAIIEFSEWRLKRKGIKKYYIIDKEAQKAVDLIDSYDSFERCFEKCKFDLYLGIWRHDRYKFEYSMVPIEDQKEISEDTNNSKQETN